MHSSLSLPAQRIPHRIAEAIREAIVELDGFTPLHEPTFDGNEWAYVRECIDTGWVSSAGSYVDQFEEQLADFTGARRAVAVVNGTAALHTCLRLVGVEAGDEVLIPALTFVATANAVAYQSAIPHFVDSDERTLGLNPQKLEAYLHDTCEVHDGTCINTKTGRPIKAVVPMHTYGHPVDLDPLHTLCERYHLALVEDSAESLGSYYKGTHTGTVGRCAALSFNGNKVITTGGGGAILTNDEVLADHAKHLTTTAKRNHRWEYVHTDVGYNYRMPNMNAALGCAQLEQMPSFIRRKRTLAAQYRKVFQAVDGVTLVEEPAFAQSNYWLNALLLDPDVADQRDAVLEHTNDADLMTRPAWTLLHKLPMYAHCPRMDLATAEHLEQRLINIPSSPTLAQTGQSE